MVTQDDRRAWQVRGMDCAACVAKVARAVERLPGVSEVSVNLMAERMTARLDPALGDPAAVEAAVSALGYGARRIDTAAPAPVAVGHAPAHGRAGHDHAGRGAANPAGHGCAGHDHGDHDHAGHDHAGHDHADHDHAGHDHAGHGGRHDAPPFDPGAAAHGHHHDHDDPAEAGLPVWRTARARLVAALAALAAAAWLLARAFPAAEAWIYGIATVVAVAPFARRALALARAGTPFSIEMLMVVAALGAVAIGAAAEAATVVLLFALGEWLEGVAAGSARAGIRALLAAMPRTARRRGADGAVSEVAAEALRPGDVVLLRPGERAACDGVVIEGRSAMDESPVTGESVPVERGPGEAVLGGSVAADGALAMRVTRAGADSAMARIAALVAEATASRGRSQRFVERFAAWWTPAAMAAAALVAIAPPLLGGGEWGVWLYRGLALLLVACPCALVISVPAAMASGLSAGARRGLLVKNGTALEAIGTARAVCFDKTGTLTAGRPRLTAIETAAGLGADEALRLAAAVERESAHPLARAVVAAAEARGLPIPAVTGAGAEPGRGVRGTAEGRALILAHPRHVSSLAADGFAALQPWIEARENDGHTVAVLAEERPGAAPAVLAALALRDEPRADAAAGVAAVRALGLRPVMLTGDNRRAGAAIAAALGLDARAELRPADKLEAIAALRREGPVLMVGDGINDAPALAAATAGIAMGGGTEAALEAADAAVLRDRVSGVAELVTLSRATLGVVRQNVAVALGLKAVFLLTTIAGITGLWPAILADTGATVLVTLNALRLLRWAPPETVPGAAAEADRTGRD